jgi:hypothetical protein
VHLVGENLSNGEEFQVQHIGMSSRVRDSVLRFATFGRLAVASKAWSERATHQSGKGIALQTGGSAHIERHDGISTIHQHVIDSSAQLSFTQHTCMDAEVLGATGTNRLGPAKKQGVR